MLKEIKSLRDWLELVRIKPQMYLGSENLLALHTLIVGFDLAQTLYNISPEQKQTVNGINWAAFEKFVTDNYNPKQLTLNSFCLAQYKAWNNSSSVFEMHLEYPGAWSIWWNWYDEWNNSL